MKYIINDNINPYFNLALEEYCLKNIDEDVYFILWQNEPSIIIGKNQNVLEEINPYFIEEKDIHLARRISGGGTVYHDLGNLNFSFFSKFENMGKIDFGKFAGEIVKVLEMLDVNAELTSRNDILINGKKISGNAQRIYRDKFLQHGTLLFDVNKWDLKDSLKTSNFKKISSIGVKSIRSSITNIKDCISKDMDMKQFKQFVQGCLSNDYKSKEIKLSNDDICEVKKLVREKFESWEWIYGKSPKFDIENEITFGNEIIDFKANVEHGVFREIVFHSNFLNCQQLNGFEEMLKNKKYHITDIRKLLNDVSINSNINGIPKEKLISLLFGKKDICYLSLLGVI